MTASLPVPDVFLSIVDVGDTRRAYECPGVDAQAGLVLEPEEEVVGRYSGEFRGPGGILSSTTQIIVTTHRFAWIDPGFEAGASWSRVGGASASARGREAARRVAAGHVRHEWVVAIRLRKHRDASGAIDSYVDLTALTSQGNRTLTGYFAQEADADAVAAAAVKATSDRWLAVGAELLTPEDAARLGGYSAGERPEPSASDVLEWRMPGDEAAAALARHLAAVFD
jgi:hypothetical protein